MSEELDRPNSVPKKLLAAREYIRRNRVKKEGKNKGMHFEYFTPDQVIGLITPACLEVGLVSTFSLQKDELGYFGSLITVDVETGDSLTSIMRTELPEIRAVNAAQQMGGMMTYTKRYMLMNEYDIADNNSDFDSDSMSVEASEAKPKSFLKKPLMEKPEPIITGKPAEDDVSEIDSLRAQCDELGIAYTNRHKEAGLKKLIKDAVKEIGEIAEEPEEDEDPYSGSDTTDDEIAEDVIQMAFTAYMDKIASYTSKDELKADAVNIITDAGNVEGFTSEELDTLKKAINTRYQSL